MALALALTLIVVGCDRGGHTSVTPIRPAWHEVTLPTPPGPAGRLAVRDATACAGRWYLVGAVIGGHESSRPAAWTSDDGRTWTLMTLHPTTYYARRAVLTSVACRDGRVAMVGSRSGGAHGNPRVTSWYPRADGALVDMRAPFELYGGPEAISVRHVAAGPHGWLIAGNRLSGASVWPSTDATDFRIVDDDPALRSNANTRTTALDQVWDGAAWTVVGRVETTGRVSPGPLAWTSADGDHWTRQPVPAGTAGFADLERVVDDDGTLVAVGLRGDRFGVWQRTGAHWRAGDAFGKYSSHLTGPPFVSGLVARSRAAVTAVSDGRRFGLYATVGGRRWRPVAAPTRPTASGDTQLSVASDADEVLLLSDDGTTGRVWLAEWSSFSA